MYLFVCFNENITSVNHISQSAMEPDGLKFVLLYSHIKSNKLASGGQLILREAVLEQNYITTSASSRVLAI